MTSSNCTADEQENLRKRRELKWRGNDWLECICQVDAGERYHLRLWDYIKGERFERWMWMPQGAVCACGGTGWVCATCHGMKWTKLANARGYVEAQPCPQCSAVVDRNVEPNVLLKDFIRENRKPVIKQTARTVDYAKLNRERAAREAARRQFRTKINDEMVSEEIYEDDGNG